MISIEYLRQFRVGQFTIFDTVAAYIGVLILSPVLTLLMSKLHLKISTVSWLWFTLPLSVAFHIAFHQSTPLTKILANPGNFQFYVVTFVLFGMTYMGFKKINKTNPS